MVTFLEAVILGIIQGITEWLPISSSGHLVLFQKLFGVSQPLVFDVFLHIGSLVVVFAVFWKDIKRIAIGVLRGEKYFLLYTGWLIIATIPIALTGYFLNDLIKEAFTSLRVVGISFLITALFLFLSGRKKEKKEGLKTRSVIWIGVAQALALLPGVSRSGMTISSGLMQGVQQKEVARFSFLLFVPAILGAMILELPNLNQVDNFAALGVGMLITIVVGFFSLKLLLKIIKSQKFSYFGWYCLFLGIVTLI